MQSTSLEEILLSLPSRFIQEKSSNKELTIHLLLHEPLGGAFTVITNAQQCKVLNGLHGQPSCIVKCSGQTYLDIELGKENAQMKIVSGEMVISDLMIMMEFIKLFHKYKPQVKSEKNSHTEGQTQTRKPQKGPLRGIRILDLTRLLPGPMATMLMADMGAEVIKIEDPSSPDYIRSFPPFFNGKPANYLALNRSKRSLALSLRKTAGLEIFKQLVKQADIVMESFRPGVTKKIGIDYETLKKYNDKIIYLSLTGYGQYGAYSNLAGHDVNYVGYSGLLGLAGKGKDNLQMPAIQVADIAAGAYQAVNACLASLWARERNGEGEYIDLAMVDSCLPFAALSLAESQSDDYETHAAPVLGGKLANYNLYKSSDGKFFALGTLEPKFWEQFCDTIGKPEWKVRILGNTESHEVLKLEIQKLFSSQNSQYWMDMASETDFCISPILDIHELQENPHLRSRKMIIDENIGEGQTWKAIGIPIKFKNNPSEPSWSAPELGQDTCSILQELGYDSDGIRDLYAKNVVS